MSENYGEEEDEKRCRSCRFAVTTLFQAGQAMDDFICRMPRYSHESKELPPEFPYADKHEGCDDYESLSGR